MARGNVQGTVDDRYFEWLYSRVLSVRNRNPARSYWNLAKQLYVKEFVWLIANDDNRVADGKDLRTEFVSEQGSDGVTQEWLDLGCSFLEMLIALSRRLEFEVDTKPAGDWFGELLNNMGVGHYSDDEYTDEMAQAVDEIMDTVIYRTYTHTGHGGLFPLNRTSQDQRKVELWYQMSAYLAENGYF